jgi:predicted phage terminase large subunit-like protein
MIARATSSNSHVPFLFGGIMEKLLQAIYKVAQKKPDTGAFQDMLDICREASKTDIALSLKYGRLLSEELSRVIPRTDGELISKLYQQHRNTLRFLAPNDFDSYIQFMEWERDPKKKFYVPRRPVLKTAVKGLQDLEDDVLDILGISMPPGTGKTTLALFYLTWIGGKYSDEPTLTGSHSNAFIRGAYDECLRMMDKDGEYLWREVFPTVSISNTNAKDCRIDIGNRKRFETLEFTSIGTGNAGLYRAARLLYCDDLVSGIEVAMSKERLDKLWEIYTTDLRQRKIGDHCKELHIATRWSVHDILGRLERQYGNDDRARFIVLPALNENDESNFDYAYGVGFSTKAYHEQRDIMDDVSWRALYQNEPIEREGLLYSEDELRRYYELPDQDPDAIIAICDTKDTGKDYGFMPVAYLYGSDYYIEDCVCTNALAELTDACLAAVLLKNKVQSCRFESNSAGGRIADKVYKEVIARGGITHITKRFTTSNKETRIVVNAEWVKQHCLFKDKSRYAKKSQYGDMINMLCSYTMTGKNKHDDVPDGMAMFAEYAQSLSGQKVEVFKRPW